MNIHKQRKLILIQLNIFFYGTEILVNPVTSPMNSITQLASQQIWLPSGNWIDWFKGIILSGPAVYNGSFALNEMPLFVKAGTIIPQLPPSPLVRTLFGSAKLPLTQIVLSIFPSTSISSYSSLLYDDDGSSQNYDSAFTWTNFSYSLSGDFSTITIGIPAIQGSYPGMPTSRYYDLKFMYTWPASTVSVNGNQLQYTTFTADGAGFLDNTPEWQYDATTLTLHAYTGALSVTQDNTIMVQLVAPLNDSLLLSGIVGSWSRLEYVKTTLDDFFGTVFMEQYESLVVATDIQQQITSNILNTQDLLVSFNGIYNIGLMQVEELSSYLPAANITQLVQQLTSYYTKM